MEELKSKITADKKCKIICAILLAVVVVLYNFIWLNRTFTLSEGWSKVYISMIKEGKIVYKDFFYFLPPFNLLIDALIWRFSGGYFFVFRLWRLLERVILVELIYSLLGRKFKPFTCFFVSFSAAIMFSANAHDLIGDYNQTAQLCIVLLTYAIVKYFEQLDAEKSGIIYVGLAGVIGGCMLGIKQSTAIACVIVFFVFLCVSALLTKE